MEEETYHSTKSLAKSQSGVRSPNAQSSPSSVNTDDFQSCHESEEPEMLIPALDGNVALVSMEASSPPPQNSQLSPPPQPEPVRDATLLEQTLFFFCGLGTSICYIATLSSLVYFKLLYGAASFVYLNLAVYVPLLPISLAQARWDQKFDLQYQSRRTFLVRGVVGFLLGLIGTIQMVRGHQNPHSGLSSLVIHALLQGTGGAILYGALNQLASFVGSDDGRQLKTSVSAGVQASALVVLAVSIATGFGVHNAPRFSMFLWNIVAIEGICFILFLWLLTSRPQVAAAMIRRDSSLRLEEDAMDEEAMMGTPLIESPRSSQRGSSVIELSFCELLQRSASCCWVMVVTLVPSFLVGSWFTQVQTNWMALASWLFYIRIAADFIGRVATIAVPPRKLSHLTWTCLLRLVPVIIFFINAHQATALGGGPMADLLSIVLVATIAFLSGYLVTGCFQLAPMGLDWQIRQANVAKQASVLTVAFAVSALGGLLSSFTLMALGV